jgi:hypothetical protein
MTITEEALREKFWLLLLTYGDSRLAISLKL